jgi:uncharacterized glyoxalase superfamily protein PhnB
MRGIVPYLQVTNTEDAIAWYARVFKAGAEQVYPLADQFYGDRAGRVRDPFGHHWIIATRIREVTEAEMVEAFRAMFDQQRGTCQRSVHRGELVSVQSAQTVGWT